MKKRKVNPLIKDLLERKLKTAKVNYRFLFQDGVLYCESTLSGENYHTMVTDCWCELQRGSKRVEVFSYDRLTHTLTGMPRKSGVCLETDNQKLLAVA